MSGLAAFEPLAREWLSALAARGLEATLVALVALAVVRFGRRLSSPLRHGLLVVVLLKFLLPPIPAPWSPLAVLPDAGVGIPMWAPSDGGQAPATRPAAGRGGLPDERTGLPDSGSITLGSRAQAPGTGKDLPPVNETTDAEEPPGVFARAVGFARSAPASLLLLVQLAGSLFLLVRHIGQRRRLARLAARCAPIDRPDLVDLTRAAAQRQGLARMPRLVASPDRLGPAAAGLLDRRIVLPVEVVEQISPGRLAPVLEHEVAHHRRRDLWVDLLVFAGSLVWWMNPVYWWIAAELRRRREDCCDAAALDTVTPRDYCHALLEIAAVLGGRRPALPALAHGSLSHPLGRRIRQIMIDTRRNRPSLTTPAAAFLLALALVVLPSGAGASQEPVEPPAPAESPVQERSRFEFQLAENRERIGVYDGAIEMSREGIERLVRNGLDRSFVESLQGTPNRTVQLSELRDWQGGGFDPRFADELAAWGEQSVELITLMVMVWSEVDPDYLRDLRQLDYADLDFDDAMRLSRYEVRPAWIAAWDEGGYSDLSADDLVRLRRYEVDPGYAATYRESGYELSVDDLVRLHRYEVDERAAQRLAEAGLTDFSVDDLVRLARYEVSDAYVRAMDAEGLDLSVDDLVRLKRYEVAPGYAGSLNLGARELSVDDLIMLERYEVTPELPVALLEAGYQDLSPDDLVQLQRYEVSPDMVRRLQEATSRRFSVDDLVRLKRYEVSAGYIGGLGSVGYGDLSVDDIIRLKRYEVTADFIARLQSGGFDDLTVDRIIRLKRADS